MQEPEVLLTKPAELYAKIRIVAMQRYGMELPAKQSELRCLQHQNNKIALMRDICLKIGVKLIAHSGRDYCLENDLQVVLASRAQAQSQMLAQSQTKKRSAPSQQVVSGQSEFNYDTLPFQASDFAEVFPVVKHLEL